MKKQYNCIIVFNSTCDIISFVMGSFSQYFRLLTTASDLWFWFSLDFTLFASGLWFWLSLDFTLFAKQRRGQTSGLVRFLIYLVIRWQFVFWNIITYFWNNFFVRRYSHQLLDLFLSKSMHKHIHIKKY